MRNQQLFTFARYLTVPSRSESSSGEEDQIEDEIQEDLPADDESSDSDEDNQQSGQPYNELLQLLQAKTDNNVPARKKRKISHQNKEELGEAQSDVVATGEEGDVQSLDDDLQQQEPDEEGGLEEQDLDIQEDSDDDENGELSRPIFIASFLLNTENDPFESHFQSPNESELSQKIKAASENKWGNVKKELPGGLKIWRAVPDCGQNEVPLSGATKSLSSVKVSQCFIQLSPVGANRITDQEEAQVFCC